VLAGSLSFFVRFFWPIRDVTPAATRAAAIEGIPDMPRVTRRRIQRAGELTAVITYPRPADDVEA
jgi:hypothetical protein